MAKTPETLDEKLRERARKKLMEELNKAAEPLRRLVPANPLYIDDDEEYSVTHAISDVVSAIYDGRKDRYEREEIDGFMKDVDSLQEQIDELHQGL